MQGTKKVLKKEWSGKYYKKNGGGKYYKNDGVVKKTELEWKMLRGMERRDCSNKIILPEAYALCRMLKLQRKAVSNYPDRNCKV